MHNNKHYSYATAWFTKVLFWYFILIKYRLVLANEGCYIYIVIYICVYVYVGVCLFACTRACIVKRLSHLFLCRFLCVGIREQPSWCCHSHFSDHCVSFIFSTPCFWSSCFLECCTTSIPRPPPSHSSFLSEKK